ncbi:MAG TPA: SH3 domain-containing protein [Granulicella sp.]
MRVLLLLVVAGCSSLRPKPADNYVYVTAKATFLRDRVAAVSNRTGTVSNGDRLKVLERGRRFLRVQTDKGVQGWIDEKVVAPQTVFDGFEDLKSKHEKDPAIATGATRDEVYLHLRPGRDTERLFRLSEAEKLQLLMRATLPKAVPPGQAAAPAAKTAAKTGDASEPVVPPPPAMEDWWLVRDSHGNTGWMLSRLMDVDAPDVLTRYSEGQRIVGAYVLNRVNDPEAPQDDKNIPQYLAVLSPYKAGLTYDFDQVRLFIWNVKKHRYETGFRDRNIEGYLPVQILTAKDPSEKGPLGATALPAFRYRVLAADSPPVVPDPATGAMVPGKTITKTYRLEGNITHRLLASGETPPDEAHPVPPEEKKGKRKR